MYFVPLKPSYSKILYLFTDNDYKHVNSSKKKFISFRIIPTITPDIYELYLYNEQKTNIQKHSYASIPDIQTSKWVKELVDTKDECIVEWHYLSDKNPKVIEMKPGWWHGYKALEPGSVLLYYLTQQVVKIQLVVIKLCV